MPRMLLRVTAATGVLPRVAGADGAVDGQQVRTGDRLLLVARHAAGAHHSGPDCDRPGWKSLIIKGCIPPLAAPARSFSRTV